MNRHPDLSDAQLEGEPQHVFIPEGTDCVNWCVEVVGENMEIQAAEDE